MAKQVGHPMAAAFEKAVADKMGKGRANKQGTPGSFPKIGHRNQPKVAPRPFARHAKNMKVVSAKRGQTH